MIALQLASGKMRLTSLQRSLPGISTGVLERYVQQMVATGLIDRSRFKEVPPRVELELTPRGRELLPIAGALARWGMRNLWSLPGEREKVGLELLLRLLPVLLEDERALPEGMLEVVITEPKPSCRVVYSIEDGQLKPTQDPKAEMSACVVGPTDAWIAALGPTADYTRLEFAGERDLAMRVLAALPDRRDRQAA
jgi:DNA-binding HxlR family transcriptional regulator